MYSWPHAPSHLKQGVGTYFVTASTVDKLRLFNSDEKLEMLHDTLLRSAVEFGWQLQAWAVLQNHYHFIAHSPEQPGTLSRLIRSLHGATSRELNKIDGQEGRKVWHNYWDTPLTYRSSYLARLNYVHNNPVKHRLVEVATHYKWCSASWFKQNADPVFFETVSQIKTDRLNVPDNFD